MDKKSKSLPDAKRLIAPPRTWGVSGWLKYKWVFIGVVLVTLAGGCGHDGQVEDRSTPPRFETAALETFGQRRPHGQLRESDVPVERFTVPTRGQGLVEVTREVADGIFVTPVIPPTKIRPQMGFPPKVTSKFWPP